MIDKTLFAGLVQAVVLTKGDRDISPVVEPLRAVFPEVFVWDNSRSENWYVYSRYAATALSPLPIVYVQDDDCIVDAAAVLAAYEPGRLVANMRMDRRADYAGTGICLVGWGAIFEHPLIDFGPYLAKYRKDELFLRECDRIFTWLNRDLTVLIDVPVQHLSYASGPDRMGSEPRHGADYQEIRRRLATL